MVVALLLVTLIGDIDLKSVPLDGRGAEAAVEPLRRELVDTSLPDERRQQVAYLLGRIGSEARSAVSDLMMILDTEPQHQRWVLKSLALFGVEAAPAVPQLMRVASDSSVSLDVRLLAAEGLANSAIEEPSAIAWFHNAVRDRSLSVYEVRGVVGVAGLLGPAGAAVVPSLTQRLESDDAEVRRLAATSLGMIGERAALDALAITMFDDAPEVADAAAAALDRLGHPANRVFLRLLEHDDGAMRRRVIRSWTRASHERTAALEASLDDDDRGVRLGAAMQLLGTNSEAAASVLHALSDGKDGVAHEARKALHDYERRRGQ